MARIHLITPPASSVWHLPAGAAYLTGYLTALGHEMTQSYAYITSVESVLRMQDAQAANRALNTVRSFDAKIVERYEARLILERISSAIPTGDTFRMERNNVVYDSSYYDGSIEGAIQAVLNREQHLFTTAFVTEELPRIESVLPHVCDISISDERQLIPGLVLGALVKDAFPTTTVILGGNLWSRLRHAFALPGFERLISLTCHGIVVGEGYVPMRMIAQGAALEKVSQLVWVYEGRVKVNPATASPIDFETLPAPIFSDGATQWSPDRVVPLYTTSNCEKRCGFCAISAGSDTYLGRQRKMTVEHIVRDMVASGCHRFDFTDELLSVERQIAIGNALCAIGYPATWQCYLTITKDLLDPSLCQQLADAGCRAVQLGLESLDPIVLGQEKKAWNNPGSYGVILRNLRAAGIKTHVFIIVGIPGEGHEYTLRWPHFLRECGDAITTIKAGRYRLTRQSPEELFLSSGGDLAVRKDLAHLSLIEMKPDTQPLKANRQFTWGHGSGLSNKKVDALRDILEEACRRHWAYGVTSTIPWWTNRGRYTWEELEVCAKALPEEDHVDLSHTLPKVRTILGRDTVITFEDLENDDF